MLTGSGVVASAVPCVPHAVSRTAPASAGTVRREWRFMRVMGRAFPGRHVPPAADVEGPGRGRSRTHRHPWRNVGGTGPAVNGDVAHSLVGGTSGTTQRARPGGRTRGEEESRLSESNRRPSHYESVRGRAAKTPRVPPNDVSAGQRVATMTPHRTGSDSFPTCLGRFVITW